MSYMKFITRIFLFSAVLLLSAGAVVRSQVPAKEQLMYLQQFSPEQLMTLKEQQLGKELQQQVINEGLDVSATGQATGQGKRTLADKPGALGLETDIMGQIVPIEDSLRITSAVINEYIRFGKIDTMNVFGRELFSRRNAVFAPSLNIPTPSDYALAVGDEIFLDMWGDSEASHHLNISPDGYVNVPNVGPINVRGTTIGEAEQRIRNNMAEVFSGLADGSINIKVSLGNIRSINVNVVGEARNPGTYTLPSLSTLFNALYAAGGVSLVGSLRNVKLYRGGKEIAALDVYDYLIDRKEDVNVRLEDNDMIVVSSYDHLVKLDGKVKRACRYEMKRGETVADLLRYSGGFSGDAYTNSVTVDRKAGGRQHQIFTVNQDEMKEFALVDQDAIAVGEVSEEYANRIVAVGAVWREGAYELSDKISTVSKLLAAAEGPRDDAYMGRAQVIRTHPDKTRELIPVNLADLVNFGEGDFLLQKNDSLFVASVYDLQEVPTVSIKGEVNVPGMMLYASNMTVQDLIVMGKGLKESASLAKVEVARRIKSPNSTSYSTEKSQIYTFNISSDLGLNPESASFRLEPFDEVYVRRSPGYNEQEEVTIEGEVMFAGKYVLSSSGERLSDLVKKAGGFTGESYTKGAYLHRQLVEDDIYRFASLSKITNKTKSVADTTTIGGDFQVGSYYSVGIDLELAVSDPGGSGDLVLKKGDRLVVPATTNTVKINGAVYYPNTVTYAPGQSLRDYISQGGGYTKKAYRKPFVVYMNGLVASSKRGRSPEIVPGCEIVVPEKEPRSGAAVMPQILSVTSSLTSMAALIATMVK